MEVWIAAVVATVFDSSASNKAWDWYRSLGRGHGVYCSSSAIRWGIECEMADGKLKHRQSDG